MVNRLGTRRLVSPGGRSVTGRRSRTGKRLRARRLSQARREGYQYGWEQGYRLGRCRVVENSIRGIAPPVHPFRVMYITSGLGVPYAPLDQIIAANLGQQVAELTVVRPYDDVLAAARQFRPQVAIALDGVQMFSPVMLEGLRNMGIRTAVWFVDDPYYTDSTTTMAFQYDHVFTIELSCYRLYQDMGHKSVHYMPLGVEPQIYRPMQVPPKYLSDICFIGTAFWNRVQFFDAAEPMLRGKKLRIIGLWWDRMKNYRRLKSDIWLNQWLSPEETARYYNGARIVVNLHRASDDITYNRNSMGVPALSLNPRAFEITACGAFQLSDVREDMPRFLQPGGQIETFTSIQEFVDKVQYYLANIEARQMIAAAGYKRVLEEHTFRRRIADMLRIISESSGGRPASQATSS